MRYFWALLLTLGALRADKADLIILIETSQLTCGSPVNIAKKALSSLCNQEGTVLVGTFSRGSGERVVRWVTSVPASLGEAETCIGIAPKITPRCDSVYDVRLLGALEDALTLKRAAHIVVIASGMATDRATSVADIRKLADRQGAQLYVASLGWLENNQKAQRLLKDLVGYFEGREDHYRVFDPRAEDASARLAIFLKKILKEAAAEGQRMTSERGASSDAAALRDLEPTRAERATSDGGPSIPTWAWIAGIALIVVLLVALIVLALAKNNQKESQAPIIIQQSPAHSTEVRSAPTEAVPPPKPAPPPAPVLRRLIVHYPHAQQEVPLSPTTAPITLGRAPDNTIVIQDNTVSSRHARLFLQGNQWYVQDLGSTNGTFVNEQRVSQHPVRIGDKLRLGAIVIQIAG